MKETEIRQSVQAAFGESSYPPDLAHRLAWRLGQPPRPAGHSRVLGAIAAILALAIIGTLVYVRLHSAARSLPSTTPQSSPNAQLPPVGDVIVPQVDLDRAQLSTSGDLVTPLNLASTSDGQTVTLIGAYADSSRTVLFLRTLPDQGFPQIMIYDDSGFLNAASTGARGIIGDSVYILDTGPRPSSDGLAHLRVAIDGFTPAAKGGNWTFAFQLRVEPSFHLRLGPALTSVGSWKFTIEAFEVTSSQVHFQAVIDGAAVEDIKQDSFSMTDLNGKPLEIVTYEAGTTVPKNQIASAPPLQTRVNISWRRPATGGAYMLNIRGGGSHYVGGVILPDPVTGKPPVTKGSTLTPADYPTSAEAITFDGVFSVIVTKANPTSCGVGTGSSGTLFGLAMYFEADQSWYTIDLSTDPRVHQYRGPGTYDVTATIWPYGGSAIFVGPVRLTVASDRYPGPYTGTISGTLTWTGAATHPNIVNISGSWKCMPGGQLGPG